MFYSNMAVSFRSDILCQIAQTDCKHDFGAEARHDYYSKDLGCGDEYTADEGRLTHDIVAGGYYNRYTCYHKGSRIFPVDIRITPGEPIALLGRLRQIPIICDFTVGNFISDLSTLRSKVVWIKNSETGFDGASKGDYGFTTAVIHTTTHYKKQDSFVPFTPINADTSHFYLSKYSGAKMFNNGTKPHVVFNEANKLYIVDREYCKNNGVINKIISGHNKTINYAMNQIRGILNGSVVKQGSKFLKYITKRLGDQAQAISALRTYEGNRCVFVTHDTVVRDLAIVIGIPYVVWTYSGQEDNKGYYLFVNQSMLTPAELDAQEARAETEKSATRIENELKRDMIRTMINAAVSRIQTQLGKDVNNEEDAKNILKEIVNDVYFLDTYGNRLGGNISGINLENIEIVDFPQTKQKFDKLRLQWSGNIDFRSINITGIKNTYLCADELIKIYNVLEKFDKDVLLDNYVDFINKIIEILNVLVTSSRPEAIYNTNAKKFLSNLVVGFREVDMQMGGQPLGDEPAFPPKRLPPKNKDWLKKLQEKRKQKSEDLRTKRIQERLYEFRRGQTDGESETFFEIDENIHAFVYLVTELVNMFREHAGKTNFIDSKLDEILNLIETRTYVYKESIEKEYDYDFTLPFENNTFVQEYLQKFINYEKQINCNIYRYDIAPEVIAVIDDLYSQIQPSLEKWFQIYPDFTLETSQPSATGAPIRFFGSDVAARDVVGWAGGNKHTRKRKIHVKIRRISIGHPTRRRRTLKHKGRIR